MIQTQNGAEALFSKTKEFANSGVYRAEEPLHRVLSLVGEDGKQAAHVDATKSDCETGDVFRTSAEFSMAEDNAREKLDERVKVGEEKMLRNFFFFCALIPDVSNIYHSNYSSVDNAIVVCSCH